MGGLLSGRTAPVVSGRLSTLVQEALSKCCNALKQTGSAADFGRSRLDQLPLHESLTWCVRVEAMVKGVDLLARLTAHMEEGRRLAASADMDAYEWQCKVGDWYRAGDPLLEEVLPRKLFADYYWERQHVAPVSVEPRFLHMLAWLENVLAEQLIQATPAPLVVEVPRQQVELKRPRPDFPDVQSWFKASGFAMPPLPASLVDAIQRQHRFVFSSRAVNVDPYDYSSYVEEAMAPELEDYILVAHSGHGANSYGLSYYVAWSGLRLLLQLQWGGVYEAALQARDAISRTFEALQRLWPEVVSRVPMSPPLVVASSDFYGGCCARVGEGIRARWGAVPAEYALERLRHELGIGAAL